MLIGAWVGSSAIIFPTQIFDIGTTLHVSALQQCMWTIDGKLGIFLMSLVTFVPYSFVGAAAAIILAYSVWQWHRAGHNVRPPGGLLDVRRRQRQRRKIRVGKMLLMSFLWGSLCNLPPLLLATVRPGLLARLPMLELWLKVCYTLQFVINPVSGMPLIHKCCISELKQNDYFLKRFLYTCL